jgi:hypothetical protein
MDSGSVPIAAGGLKIRRLLETCPTPGLQACEGTRSAVQAAAKGDTMRYATILLLVAGPLVAVDGHHNHNWKLDEKENIQRTFDGTEKLAIDTLHGFVHVTGYAGSKVELSIEKHIYADSAEKAAEAKRDVKMDIGQEGKLVRCHEEGPHRSGDDENGYRVAFNFEVQVPYATALELKTLNREIQVKKTSGDFEIRGLNGAIALDEVSGSGHVATLNGSIKAVFDRNPAKPSQFKTLNGTVDVRFPSDLNADLHFKKLNGSIYTDFDVAPLPLGSGGENGKYLYRSGRNMAVRVGKGGPEMSFETLNGTIRVHSKAL